MGQVPTWKRFDYMGQVLRKRFSLMWQVPLAADKDYRTGVWEIGPRNTMEQVSGNKDLQSAGNLYIGQVPEIKNLQLREHGIRSRGQVYQDMLFLRHWPRFGMHKPGLPIHPLGKGHLLLVANGVM